MVAELWAWRWEAWLLAWALPLTSCVVWGGMFGLSGAQWLVKSSCTSHLEDCCFFFLIRKFFPVWFNKCSTSCCQCPCYARYSVNQGPGPSGMLGRSGRCGDSIMWAGLWGQEEVSIG